MDIATRFQSRARAQPYLDRERNGGLPDDSGNESESLIRRKFQRTASTSNAAPDDTFRKPSLPASASRPQLEQRQGISHHRRRSTLRDNVRVPSGPREFPSPGKRVGSGSISSLTPAVTDTTNTTRAFLPQSTSEPFFSNTGEATHFTFANTSSSGSRESPLTPAQHTDDDFGFIPTVNFDDLQNSIANYDGNGPLMSDFSFAGSDRPASDANNGTLARDSSFGSSRPPVPKAEAKEETMTRSQSFRRRLSGHPTSRDGGAPSSNASQLSLRTRRQSTAPSGPPPSGPAPAPVGAGTRAPRKSLGPGVIASMMEGRKVSQPSQGGALDHNSKAGLLRTDSLTKAARRTTMQPTTSGGSELPRSSTLTATTQSRANKVKSLQPPPRDQDPNTPHARSLSKNNQNRAHTPSSSGNKRQSTVSGRASGLGARTISPTDARRLKRLSMMQAPPVPSHPTRNNPPSPQDEAPPVKPELPRLTQPSPSLIPRKANNGTPTSARASPEGRFISHGGGVSLSSKSSFQSLLSSSASASRLPTPKPRSVHSSSAQYGEDEEIVPPVPAIPKAFESPRETDQVFFSNSAKPTQSGVDGFDHELSSSHRTPKSSVDMSYERRRKPSTDLANAHQRINTIENIERSVNMTAPKGSRAQVDPTGRKNNNLQPLRLPPLNLMPINQSSVRSSHLPRPSQDMDMRDDYGNAQTPEPRRTTKTPSTPMTASKATFYRRHDEDLAKQQGVRSSSSHFALRDLMQLDDATANYFDDADAEYMAMGLPIPSSKPRNAITPFASGSLPKGSGEFVRQRGRPSMDFNDDFTWNNFESLLQQNNKPQGPRPSRSGTKESFKPAETPSSLESPVAEPGQTDHKKESSGLRRKLSLSWRRSSSSKAAHHADHKSTSHQDVAMPDKDTIQKRTSQMPPPKLPASATWSGDIPAIPNPVTTRPSLDATRRKGVADSVGAAAVAPTGTALGTDQKFAAPKNKSLHAEQPQPVSNPNRASSWGNIGSNIRPPNQRPVPTGTNRRQVSMTPSISSLIKDKDDHAADEEMRRLSQKRRDVDTAARESEELKNRATAKPPVTPEHVLHNREYNLNIFERGEVMDYEKDGIYFTGTKTARKIIGSLAASPQVSGDKDTKAGNFGYDDERGDYNIVLGDHLAYRYEVVDVLGKGSFGQVVRCVDHKDGGVVAVKIIRNKKRFHQQALVEVGILGRLRDWDPDGAHATLSITSSFYFRSHLCIVTPCLSINLYELIRAHNFVGFSLPLIRRFSRQLLSCLVLLQNKKIIHCDLKPENILLCEARKADVRVIDFGSSCKEEEKVYTYIQSRFYRSPEVILGSSYGLGIDMWSLGCILAELWTGYPLFPGENEQEQLACIMEIFGPPDRHLVERCTRKKLFFDSVGKPRVTVSSKGRRRRPSSKTLSQALKSEDEAFLDFISRCLRWDPDRRMKPQDAVNHAFITNQPLHQRPGIPDEARRAARLRSTAAVPAANGGIPSPVKRTHTTSGVHGTSTNAFNQQQSQQTPAKEKTRPLPETPQTAVRTGVASNHTHQNQGSPSKQSGAMRRQSSVVTASAAATAGSKRASNGLPVSSVGVSANVQQRQPSGNNLAAMAAREANAARWRA